MLWRSAAELAAPLCTMAQSPTLPHPFLLAKGGAWTPSYDQGAPGPSPTLMGVSSLPPNQGPPERDFHVHLRQWSLPTALHPGEIEVAGHWPVLKLMETAVHPRLPEPQGFGSGPSREMEIRQGCGEGTYGSFVVPALPHGETKGRGSC